MTSEHTKQEHYDDVDDALLVAQTNMEGWRVTHAGVEHFLTGTAGPVDPEYLDRVAERREEAK